MTLFLSEPQEILFVESSETGIRIDKFLAEKFPTYSRSYFQYLIEQGAVLLNGSPIKKRICPEEGDEIEICFQAIPSPSLHPEPIPLNVLYEDEHIIAINKPPGMVVHPAPGHPSGTFVNALLAHCEQLAPSTDPLRPGIVHRLDKETSGVLLAAKTLIAHQKLIEAFSQRKVLKTYLAICIGRPPNGVVNAPIGRHPNNRKEMAVVPKGKEAISDIQTLAFQDPLSFVMIRPKTGRTHQIRVHLKSLGSPILGDPIYGSHRINQALAPPRLLLHAYRIIFDHPVTRSQIHLTAPIPDDLKGYLLPSCQPGVDFKENVL